MLETFLILQIPILLSLIVVILIILKRKKNKKSSKRKALLILLFYFVLLACILYPYRFRLKRWINEYFSSKVKIDPPKIEEIDYTPVSVYSIRELGKKLPKDNYKEKHRPKAIATTNNLFISNQKVLDEKLKERKLISVEEKDGFYMKEATYSSQILTPLAAERLWELGELFRSFLTIEANKKDYFVISSMTRTEEQQQKIRKRYPRQATQGSSTHSFGVSFDISEIHSRGDRLHSFEALNRALLQMRNEGKILLCPESTCIHITVIK